ncbi:MAG: MBL fold metallo-hydrolase [Propionibacteriaceae bacterium]|nr:MBL fold metallo-hydrolase [Propionibacteriaceae bacterium]
MTVGIHPLVSPWGRFGLYSYFIDAPEPAIIDTGIASSPAEGMAPALATLGRRLEDVRWILHTHGHIDHIGGTAALVEATGRRAQVAIHTADADLLRSPAGIIAKNLEIGARYAPTPTLEADQQAQADTVISGGVEPTVLLQGGEELDLGGGVRIVVHHVPGHTAGSVAYEVVGQGDLFTGDTVMLNGAASGIPGYDDPVDYRASLVRLRDEVRPQRLYLGHPYRWTTGESPGVVVEDAARALAESIAVADRIAAVWEQTAADGVRETASPYSPFEAAASELGYAGDPTHEPWSFFTTLHGHLRRSNDG